MCNVDKVLCEFKTCTLSLRHSQLAIFDSQFVLPHFSTLKINNLHIWALETGENSKNSPICQVTLEECLINKLRHAQITVCHVPERIGQRNSLGCSSQRNHWGVHKLGRIFNTHNFRHWKCCHFPRSECVPNSQCSTKSLCPTWRFVARPPDITYKSEAKAQHLCESPNHLRLSQRP